MEGFYLVFNVKKFKVIVKHKCHFSRYNYVTLYKSQVD